MGGLALIHMNYVTRLGCSSCRCPLPVETGLSPSVKKRNIHVVTGLELIPKYAYLRGSGGKNEVGDLQHSSQLPLTLCIYIMQLCTDLLTLAWRKPQLQDKILDGNRSF